MLRQFLKRVAVIRKQQDYCCNFVRALSSDVGKVNLEVKINQRNETFELHDTEIDASSGKQKKFEFPFVYLRDNCQVNLINTSSSRSG
jgi:hypothetical protein